MMRSQTMPKVILEFTTPEEKEELEWAMKGFDNFMVVEGIDDFLRAKIKHADLTELEEKIYQEVRDKLWELRRE